MAKRFSLVLSVLCLVLSSRAHILREDVEQEGPDTAIIPPEDKRKADFLFGDTAQDEADEPEEKRNTLRLLNAVMMDGATVKGGHVYWFIEAGEKTKCIDGKKTLEAKCKWTGMVTPPGGSKPETEKLNVYSKYCNKAGLAKLKPKVIPC